MPPKGQGTDIASLSIEQLSQVKQNLEEEMQNLSQSVTTFQKVAGAYGSSGQAIQRLAQQEEGQTVMVPLTESLYVAGELVSSSNILIDIGTGYYVEKTTEQGTDYFLRRVNYVKDKLDDLGKHIRERNGMLQTVTAMLEKKMAAAQRDQGPSSSR